MNNYNDDLPDWLQDEKSDNDPGKAEIEPPTDGPPPDWMRVATSGSDTSLKDENTPDWLKDIKAGKGKAKENDVNNSEPSATSSPDAGSDGLSDWERLLAEEGIDLSTVSEDRPQGAEGMSARDWLIASSDDEMIRKRVGGEPMTEPQAEKAPPPVPQPEPAPAEHDKMVVEEDLPDWLRDEVPVEEVFAPIAEEPVLPPAAGEEKKGLVVEAELPDWLQEFSEEEEEPVLADPVRPGTAPLAGPPAAHDEDKMVVEEDLPEWLREVADEVAAEPALAENLSDKSMAGLPISDFGATNDEDLPDWLREAAAIEPAEEEAVSEALEFEPAEAPAPAVSWGDSMVVEEGLPDWLREVEEEAERDELAVEQVAQAPALEEAELVAAGAEMPDWLRQAEEEGGEAEELLLEYEAAGEAAAPIAEMEEEGLPGWLQEAEAEPQPVPQDQLVVEEELPDWLREVEEEKAAEEEELPGWLQEAAEEEEEQLVAAGEVEAPVGVTAGVEDIIDTEGLPDWLQEVQEEEAFEPSEPSPEEEFVAEEELTLEGELPEWLRQVQDETQEVTIDEFDIYGEEEAEPVGEGEVIVAEELPDWLRGLEEEPEPEPLAPVEPAAVEAPAAVAEARPAPAEKVAAPPPEPEPAAVAPVPAPAAVEKPKPQPRPAPAGLPDWLKKLREGEREEEKAVAARPAPRPAPALAAVEERSVVEIKTEEPAPDLPTDAEERLKLAREARDEGNLENAVQIYDTLVSSGVYLHQIIEDMQQTIKSYPSNYLLYQLMGDAMMREGRLQSALEAYRQALARL